MEDGRALDENARPTGPSSGPASAEAAWAALAAHWQMAFELAWESFAAGSIPVGAVVVDGDGRVVARGRSRAYEEVAPPGQLAGTYLAHAEVNALAQLPRGTVWDHVLYTTLEPCLLCTAAATHVHVGTVVYAAPDPLWVGIERLPELNDHVRRRFHARHHADLGPLSVWASALPSTSRMLRLAADREAKVDDVLDDPVFVALTAARPAVADVARSLAGAHEDGGLVGSLPDVLSRHWPLLRGAFGTHPDADRDH